MAKKAASEKQAPLDKHKVWINGISGRMGQKISEILQGHDSLTLLGGSDSSSGPKDWLQIENSELIIDFSLPEGNLELLERVSSLSKKRILIGTTGIPEQTIARWQSISARNEHLVLLAPNTSLGIYTFAANVGRFAKTLAAATWDIEITETHHKRKQDAPSGTALFLAKMIHKACPDHKLVLNRSGARETQTIGVHAIRGGGVFGEHEVRFIGEHEELYIGHRAFSRELFADGALRLGQQLFKSHKTGFIRLEDWQDPEVH